MNNTLSIIFLFLTQVLAGQVNAQTIVKNKDANELLKKVNSRMLSIQEVSYEQYKELFYKDNGHREKDAFSVLLKYTDKNESGIPKYQIKEIAGDITTIYNGTETFVLNNNTMSLDIKVDTTALIAAKHRFFRQSWPNIRNLLSHIIMNDSIQKSVVDTIIRKIKYFSVKIDYPGRRFNPVNGFYNIGVDSIEWKYELLIDKRTLLPKEFNVNIITPGNKEDFIKVSYEKITVNPKLPEVTSWYYSSYKKQYPNHNAKRNELVKAGIKMPAWKLPRFTMEPRPDTLTSETQIGKVILLEFWIKGCGYCMDALPQLNKLQLKFGRDSFQLITINCYDSKQEIGYINSKYTPAYLMCYNGLKLAEDLGIYGFPMTILIDRNGNIAHVAPFNIDLLTTKIGELLKSSG